MDMTQHCKSCAEWYRYDLGACPYCGTPSERLIEQVVVIADEAIPPFPVPGKGNRKQRRAAAARQRQQR
ncbi:hypothetical protein GCM10023209_19790 [Roseibacterium beibuensis]|uniref:Uncharacterized protein n=1 Tax=[Roseibacterium] beibuensis TaxID=1193142 RepID=A0ABP9LCS6_9RHOB